MKLTPVIVQDADTKEVLMLAYADEEALRRTRETGEAWYWSRSRKRLWRKGKTSGNTQKVIDVVMDCDKDAVLYRVRQRGVACHTGSYSCFGSGTNVLEELFEVVKDRKKNPKIKSITCEMLGDEEKLLRKLNEECFELVLAAREGNKGEIAWETADLLYFTLVLLAANDVELGEVMEELKKRRRK
jgi:phosphoribosyl-ATP pyrophosphohydrolase/phosphoribosyl-AMP cyclohydrolase